ncbi:unnamed protein product [Porites lobata]|uniref:CWH43-like N-terminal domain-containing protein n=1 Tax=Porites lobata TaxID=104759 RepID=A0ABN8N1R4_9CNID|nr:unnamed protein product [Porites lobata]
MCGRCGLGFVPVALALFSLATFAVTYIISRFRNDTSWFPAISDTADHSPESNVFGFLFNMCAAVALLTTFIRYLQLRHDADWNERDRQLLIRLNKVAMLFGVLSSLGACIVANFQEDAVAYVHIIGALMVFLCGIVYSWVQSFISYKMKSCGLITSTLLVLRLLLTIGATVFFIACAAATSYASKDWVRYHASGNTYPQRWDPNDKNYIHHVVGDVSEWLTALMLLGFMASFFGEFRFVKMKIVVSRRTQQSVPLATGMGSDDPLYTSLYV